MFNKYKEIIISFLVGALLGSCLYFIKPKEKISIQKEEKKTEIKKDLEINKNTVTKIKETINKDGTKVTETEIINKDNIKEKEEIKLTEKKESYESIKSDPLNRLSLKVLTPLSLKPIPVYELNYSRTIIWALKAEISIDSNLNKKAGLALEFNF